MDVSKLQAANDAKTKLEKKGYQKNYKKEAYDNQDKTSINDLDEASEMIDYLNQLKSEYKDRVQKIADEGREPSWIEQKGLDSTKKKIDSLESDVADKVTEISDTAKSMKNDDGSLIDKKFKDTVASADAVVQKYLNSTDSTTATSDKMNNIFALSQFSDLKDKLIAAGKSGGTDAIQKMIDDTDGLKDAMSNAGLTADDLKDSIMSIADPDAKNLEGIKENLKDIFGKDGLGQSDFFKGKTDEELENFWDYLQDNNYNPKQMKWDEKTTKENFEAAQEAKKKTPEESVTFASKFKNAAEDTATDIDTVRLAGEDAAAAKGSGRFTTENDEKCREIFDIIGKKYGVAIKQVESYIKIAMNHMLSGEDGDLKLAILEALYGENPTVEEFLAFMYVVVQKDLKEDLKKTAS